MNVARAEMPGAPAAGQQRDAGPAALLVVAVTVYWVLLGGTDATSVVTAIPVVNAVVAGVLIWCWVRSDPRTWDSVDRALLVAVLSFLVVCVFASSLRSALDAATAAAGWAAAVHIGRRMAARPAAKRLAVHAVAFAGTALTLLMTVLWASAWLTWAAASRSTLPPLTLALPTLVFRHPHVVAFAVLLTLPAVVVVARNTPMRILAGLTISGATFIAFASGSRTIWVAAGLAFVLVAALSSRMRLRLSGMRWPMLAAGALGIVALVSIVLLTGGHQVLDRLTNLRTLGARGEIWSAALDAWLKDPLSGSGPGTFVGSLPLSGYFVSNDFAPRHADNGIVQILSEGGLVLFAGVLFAAIAVVRELVRRREMASTWSVAFFGFSLVTDNPTATAGLVALLVFWLAVGLPAGRRSTDAVPAANRLVRKWSFALLAILAVAYGALSVAAVSRDLALGELREGRSITARDFMAVTTALDPGMPLYQREFGIIQWALGDRDAALRRLGQAHRDAPTDQVSARVLAIAEWLAGNDSRARAVIDHAIRLMPRDPSNRLTEALILSVTDPTGAEEALARAVELNPLLPASSGWSERFGRIDSGAALIEEAWRNAVTDPVVPHLGQRPLWLRAMAAEGPPTKEDLLGAEENGTLTPSRAFAMLLDCRVSDASDLLINAERSNAASSTYWLVRLAVISAGGEGDLAQSLRLARLISPTLISQLTSEPPNPIFDPAADRRLYGRDSLTYSALLPQLPSGATGARLWMKDARAGAALSAPKSKLARCGR